MSRTGPRAALDRCRAKAKLSRRFHRRLESGDFLFARDVDQRSLAERLAINSVVQGSAADLIKIAMINLHARLPEIDPGAQLVLQVHDELVVEAPSEHADATRDLLVHCMENALELSVPIVVDVSVSESWYDAK